MSQNLSSYEPDPIHTDEKPVWEMVIEDMKQRDNEGRQKYGTPLQTSNGRDALVDLYQELLDATVYIRQELERRKWKDDEIFCLKEQNAALRLRVVIDDDLIARSRR